MHESGCLFLLLKLFSFFSSERGKPVCSLFHLSLELGHVLLHLRLELQLKLVCRFFIQTSLTLKLHLNILLLLQNPLQLHLAISLAFRCLLGHNPDRFRRSLLYRPDRLLQHLPLHLEIEATTPTARTAA